MGGPRGSASRWRKIEPDKAAEGQSGRYVLCIPDWTACGYICIQMYCNVARCIPNLGVLSASVLHVSRMRRMVCRIGIRISNVLRCYCGSIHDTIHLGLHVSRENGPTTEGKRSPTPPRPHPCQRAAARPPRFARASFSESDMAFGFVLMLSTYLAMGGLSSAASSFVARRALESHPPAIGRTARHEPPRSGPA